MTHTKRNHYIPQFYLKGFTETSKSDGIWVYERGKKDGFKSSINNAAIENNYYPQETESYLANEVEDPANPIILKIRERIPISQEEKNKLANYMTVMLKRVPENKLYLRQETPEVLESVYNDIYSQLDGLEIKDSQNKDFYDKCREDLVGISSDKQKIESMIHDAWIKNMKPESTPDVSTLLSSMIWCFWKTDNEVFITSDNPIFFFEEFGIGNEKSEVSFPLSKNIAIWASWKTNYKEGAFLPARNQIVREINRRIISKTTKYAYCSNKSDWIIKLMNKKKLDLHYII